MSRFTTMTMIAVLAAVGCLLAADPKPRIIPVTGNAVPELAEIDRVVQEYLAGETAPGVSIAISKDRKLIYARGFGYADPDRKLPVQPTSLFRIASISTVITAAAICQLVSSGKLTFDTKLLDVLKIKPLPAKMDPRWKDITIGHLYEHKAGFDRDVNGDPMFNVVEIARTLKVPSPPTRDQIVKVMLTKELDYDPGSKTVYSNFGYCLLGRAIEKLGGKTYEKYVQEELFKPIGITDAQIGKTLTTAKGEVKYVDAYRPTAPSVFATTLGKNVPTPYGAWCIECMDAHGGWIISAQDLVKLSLAIDQPDKFPAVKGQPFKDRFPPRYFHSGAFDGTSALLYHSESGITFAIQFNSRVAKNDKSLCDDLTPKVTEVLGKIKNWPK